MAMMVAPMAAAAESETEADRRADIGRGVIGRRGVGIGRRRVIGGRRRLIDRLIGRLAGGRRIDWPGGSAGRHGPTHAGAPNDVSAAFAGPAGPTRQPTAF